MGELIAKWINTLGLSFAYDAPVIRNYLPKECTFSHFSLLIQKEDIKNLSLCNLFPLDFLCGDDPRYVSGYNLR